MEYLMRMMTNESRYDVQFGGTTVSSPEQQSPEQQWIAVRKEMKREKLLTSRASRTQPCDMHIRIELVHGFEDGAPLPLTPPIWRELRVSGGINLGVFQDKILSPVMGWTRNYHGYWFIDFSDGAQWCPIGKSDAIDMVCACARATTARDTT